MEPVGIDAVEVWTGKLKLDLPDTFAPQKGEDPDKYRKGIGLVGSSFPDLHEDIVTMGANAAKRLMDRKGLTPEDIGRIDVATESAFDNSKPVSTYVAGVSNSISTASSATPTRANESLPASPAPNRSMTHTTGSVPVATAGGPPL